jgi:hypothetical protein
MQVADLIGLQIPSRRAVGPATRQRGANRQSADGDGAAEGHAVGAIERDRKDDVLSGTCLKDGRHGQCRRTLGRFLGMRIASPCRVFANRQFDFRLRGICPQSRQPHEGSDGQVRQQGKKDKSGDQYAWADDKPVQQACGRRRPFDAPVG